MAADYADYTDYTDYADYRAKKFMLARRTLNCSAKTGIYFIAC